MKQRASTSRVARHLDVADATVTDMLRKLKKAGLLEYKPYYGAALTHKGTPDGRADPAPPPPAGDVPPPGPGLRLGTGPPGGRTPGACRLRPVHIPHRRPAGLSLPGPPRRRPFPTPGGSGRWRTTSAWPRPNRGATASARSPTATPSSWPTWTEVGLRPATRLSLQEKAPFQGPLKLLPQSGREPVYLGLEASRSIFVLPLKDRPRAPESDPHGPASREAGTRGSRKSR